MSENRWIALILILFLGLGITYAVTTPPFEASDELWHYPMIQHLADGNPLPIQVFDPELAGPWKQEASQPPLYYYVGAALTFWIDTSDMSEVRRENPHVDNGLITEDGNTNLVVHENPEDFSQGALLAVRLVRLLSVLMGTGTVYLTYRIAGSAYPGRPEIALGAAAVNAFLPMFLFISGAVNNDNLAILLSSLALFILISVVAATDSDSVRNTWQRLAVWVILGIVIGMALLTKQGAIGLIPLAWGTSFVVAWLEENRQETTQTIRWLIRIFLRSIVIFIIVLIPALLIAGWWYWRNVQLYGDWLGWSAFIAVLGQRAHAASLLQLWGERHGFQMAYWGLFGGVNIPMPAWVYRVFNVLLIIAVVGFVVVAIREIRSWFATNRPTWRSSKDVIDNILRFIVDYFALVAALLFSAAVVIGLVRWATTTWSSQGRLVFTAISALSTLFAVGLFVWMPQHIARWAVGLASLFFFAVATAAPFLWIMPSYDPNSYNLANGVAYKDIGVDLGDTLRLQRAALEPDNEPLEPGDSFWVHLDWEVLNNTDRDYSVFVHAVDPVLGRPSAQRDMYLGQGLLLTSWLEAGARLENSYHIQLPETAISPAKLELVAGLYDVKTGERLVSGENGDTIPFGTIEIQSAPGSFPNPTSINFGDELELVGFSVAPRSATAGEIVGLTLHVRARHALEQEYTLFAQIIDEDTTRWASVDHVPPEGTSTWPSGEVRAIEVDLAISPETPADVYPLIIGFYTRGENGSFDRLQIKTQDGRLTDDFLEVTQIRVD